MSNSGNPMDCSPPGSSVHGKNTVVGLLFPPPGDLPHPGIEPGSSSLQADSLPSESPGKTLLIEKNCWVGAYRTQDIVPAGVYSLVGK